MKVRLKPNCSFGSLNDYKYGLITHDWRDIPDGSYVYKEMEVFSEAKPKEVIEEPKPVEPEPVKLKDVVEQPPKKKGKRFRF